MPEANDVDYIYDVTTETFEERVIAASRERPVVVDFWAPWCAPCRVLGPILEKVVRSHQGRSALARVNVDENQPLAAQYGVRGIPAVKVFRNGRLATEFVGALPEVQVERILAAVVPSPSDETAAEALRLLQEGRKKEAEQRFREVLETDENHPAAAVGLALLAVERGEYDKARRLASAVDVGSKQHEQAQNILAQLDFVDHCREAGGRQAAAKRCQADENDLDARYDLAACLAADEEYQAALDKFLKIIGADKDFRDGAAKDAMVRIFGIVGQRSELADTYRSRLAQSLY